MDDFINAHICDECRRVAPNLYFCNDKAAKDDHLRCDSSSPTGCKRCAVAVPTICCDVCHPSFFKKYDVDFAKPPRVQNRSAVPTVKAKPMTDRDVEFRSALLAWRRTGALEKFKGPVVRRFGPKVFMTEELMERVIECARARKLTSLEDLEHETSWKYTRDSEVLVSGVPFVVPHAKHWAIILQIVNAQPRYSNVCD
ncbi:hypothetical protein BKA70DRAFT_1440086 [Coprinopsis sp. MPI-PUGE-AT-0042]|nr:hypothetical protein BKA70DRAFT_1440086 [Coprinopsis sp. MPI-PUGE-AT-0042]